MHRQTRQAIILGPGNIGTDLLIKIQRYSERLTVRAMVGIDPNSDGLTRARELGVDTVDDGIEGLVARGWLQDAAIVFDATSAKAHARHSAAAAAHNIPVVDLTPAAIGPGVVPVANLRDHLHAPNVNMVTCGGQATIPIIYAISRITTVHYGEIVAAIASKSAGPGTRANIDEFTTTTARAIETIGGAQLGKAIIILNPADPPLVMRDTVYALCKHADQARITASIEETVAAVATYVPGYRLVRPPIFDEGARIQRSDGSVVEGLKVTCLLEVTGNGDFLPPYAGNLDIMTAAAMRVGEEIATRDER